MLYTFEHLRTNLDLEVEILHERLCCSEEVEFAKDLDQFRLFFLEALLAPEDLEWLANI